MVLRNIKVLLFIAFLVVTGCSGEQSQMNITDGAPARTLSEVNEELLISDASDLDGIGDQLIITERMNSRFLLLDKDFRSFTAVGQGGRGPGDLAYPTKLDTHNGKIYCVRKG